MLPPNTSPKRPADTNPTNDVSKRPRLQNVAPKAEQENQLVEDTTPPVKSEDVSIGTTQSPAQVTQKAGGHKNSSNKNAHSTSNAKIESKCDDDDESDIPFFIDKVELAEELRDLITPVSQSVLKNDPSDMFADDLTDETDDDEDYTENDVNDDNDGGEDDAGGKEKDDGDHIRPDINVNSNVDENAPSATKTLKAKERRQLRRKYQTMRAYYNTRMWSGGVLKQGSWRNIFPDEHICPRTGFEIAYPDKGSSYDVSIGTIWASIRKSLANPESKVITPQEFYGISHILESQDFSVAVRRLGRMVDPSKLSMLLGSHFRTPKYCEFILKVFLGLVNNYHIRQELKNDGFIKRQKDIDFGVEVFADESFTTFEEELEEEEKVYKSIQDGTFNDDIEKRTDTGVYLVDCSPNNDPLYEKSFFPPIPKFATEVSTTNEAPTVKTEDAITVDVEAAPTTDTVATHNNDRSNPSDCDTTTKPPDEERVDELQFANHEDEDMASSASYQTRKFLKELSGVDIVNAKDYREHCQRLGVEFDKKPDPPPDYSVLRRNAEKTPCVLAPDVGASAIVTRSTVLLWEHATKHWSGRDLSKCGLLKSGLIEMELTYNSFSQDHVDNVQDLMEGLTPVCSIAPKAHLYLSDFAAEFILQTIALAVENCTRRRLQLGRPFEDISVIDSDDETDAVHDSANTKATNQLNGNSEGMNGACTPKIVRIECSDLDYAATLVLNKRKKSKVLYYVTNLDFVSQSRWKSLQRRPFTPTKQFIVCERVPQRKVNVVVDVMEEAKITILNCLTGCFLPQYMRLFREYKTLTKIKWEKRREKFDLQEGRIIKAKYHHKEISAKEHNTSNGNDTNVTDKNVEVKAESTTDNANTKPEVSEPSTMPDVKGEAMEIEPHQTAVTADPDGVAPETDNTTNNSSSQQDDQTSHVDISNGSDDDEDEILDEEREAVAKSYFDAVRQRKSHVDGIVKTGQCETIQRKLMDDVTTMAELAAWVDEEPEEGHVRRCVCSRRMLWLIMHAIGYNNLTNKYSHEEANKKMGDANAPDGEDKTTPEAALTYGEEVNYTNFAELCPSDQPYNIQIDPLALNSLGTLVHALVIDEAEILRLCAANDSNRPWIDGADVALVKAIRKT